jgi:hypothetical protein
MTAALQARRISRAFLLLLEKLLNTVPSARPSCDRVSSAIREGKVGAPSRISPATRTQN